MLRTALRVVPTVCVACLAACGAATAPLVGTQADTTTDAPACGEATLGGADAHGGCVAAAALVKCSQDEVCISNDPTACNGSTGCHDECSTGGEYAVACDDRSGPAPQPPAGCEARERAANGTLYYCCPCSP